MAITKQVASQIVSQREQSWRVNFEMPAGGVPSIQIYREVVGLNAEGEQVGQPQQSYTPVNRTFEAVMDVVAPGTGLAFSDVVETLAELGDMWAQEDANAPPATPMMAPTQAPDDDAA